MSLSLRSNRLQDDLDGYDVRGPAVAAEPIANESGADDAARARVREATPAGGGAVVEASARASAPGAAEDAAPARDLVALYFRQMGPVELLSRADELALAQRIEARQRAAVEDLGRVPLLIDRIALWADEVRQGRRDMRTLLDLSGGDDSAEPAQEAGTEGEDLGDADAAVNTTRELPVEAMARLDGFVALAGKIMLLSRKRAVALARGRKLASRERARLEDLFARAASETGLLRLHPDRVAELVAVLEHEQRELDRIERAPQARPESDPRPILAAFTERVGLPVAEFRELAAQVSRARRDTARAREEMVRAHLPLVVAIARRYLGRSSLDLLDLIQEGNLGLMHAVEKYDHRRGVKVSTYAVWWIRQAITRAMADQGRLIRVPVHMTESVTKVLRERRKLSHKLGRNPDTGEIAASAAMPAARVEKALSLVREPLSLDVPVGEDGDATLGDLIEAPDAVDPHAVAEASALKRSLAEALAGLPEREQRILSMRFGLGGTSEHTLEEVGKAFGLTRERIRQIEAAALAKLRQPGRGRKLLTFAQA